MKIAIQGYSGCFHQMAAEEFFGKNIEILSCANFRDVVNATSNREKQCEAGIMAIENSIAGTILPNYELLEKNKLRIAGEIYLAIRQNLMVNPGVKLEDIKEVYSHQMALLQCSDFLEKYNWKLIATEDTALSAKNVHQHHHKYAAAIASKLAAKLYDLEIIQPAIQTEKKNYTRFLVLKRKEDLQATENNANKASVVFETDHTKGSLANALNCIAANGVNLSKLQSNPIAGTNFKYKFYIDMEFNQLDQFSTTIKELHKLTKRIRIFGIYKNGKS